MQNLSKLTTAKKSASYPFVGEDLDLVVSVAPGKDPVIVEVTDDAGETRQVASFSQMASKRFRIENVTMVNLSSGSPFAHDVVAYSLQRSEPMPYVDVPPPPAPRNLLARMRQEARRALGAHRETFLEAQRQSFYELSDEDEALFEEDIAEMLQRRRDGEPQPPEAPSNLSKSENQPSAEPSSPVTEASSSPED